MNIHDFANDAAQGDVLLRRVDQLPEGAKPAPRDGRVVVAHSETGHHHAIEAEGVIMFTVDDPFVCYLRLEGVEYADLVHHRSWDTHGTLRLAGAPGGTVVYEVRRQREATPEGWRRVED